MGGILEGDYKDRMAAKVLWVCFPGEPGSTGSPVVFFLHKFWKRTFRDKWQRFFYKPDVLSVTRPTAS